MGRKYSLGKYGRSTYDLEKTTGIPPWVPLPPGRGDFWYPIPGQPGENWNPSTVFDCGAEETWDAVTESGCDKVDIWNSATTPKTEIWKPVTNPYIGPA